MKGKIKTLELSYPESLSAAVFKTYLKILNHVIDNKPVPPQLLKFLIFSFHNIPSTLTPLRQIYLNDIKKELLDFFKKKKGYWFDGFYPESKIEFFNKKEKLSFKERLLRVKERDEDYELIPAEDDPLDADVIKRKIVERKLSFENLIDCLFETFNDDKNIEITFTKRRLIPHTFITIQSYFNNITGKIPLSEYQMVVIAGYVAVLFGFGHKEDTYNKKHFSEKDYTHYLYNIAHYAAKKQPKIKVKKP